MEFDVEKHWRMTHVCLVITQSSNEGSLGSNNTERFDLAQSHIAACREKLVAKREFTDPMDKYAMKVVKDNEMVAQLISHFSRIAWDFLACGEKISFEVIGHRQYCKQLCGKIEISCQLELVFQTKCK